MDKNGKTGQKTFSRNRRLEKRYNKDLKFLGKDE